MTLTTETLAAIQRFLDGLTELTAADGVHLDASSAIYDHVGNLVGYLDVATDDGGRVYAFRTPES